MSYNSKIILCKGIKLDKNYTNVLSYSEQQMLNLCNSEGIKITEASNYTFIDRNKKIRVAFSYAQCVQANYIAFQNPDYSNKWFFAFIDNVEFKGNNNTELSFTIDAWSTWFDYWQKKPCYIVREHVNNDTIGLNTVNEDLAVPDVVEEYEQEDISLSEYYWVGVLTSHDPEYNTQFNAPITVYNKNVMAKKLCLFDASDLTNLVNLGLFLMATNSQGHNDDIDSLFFIPDLLINRATLQQRIGTFGGQNYTFYLTPNDFDIKELNVNVPKVHSFQGVSIKNNKCFCYPYNYLFVSNNIGNTNIYKYENFSNSNNATFKIQATMSVGISGRLVPTNYKQMAENDDEQISLGKYPTIAWSNDAYTNWLTQQAVNIPTQLVTNALNLAGNIATGNVVGAATNIAGQIGSLIGSFYEASLLPNTTNGQNTADINFLAERNTFTFRGMRAKTEYIKIIDDYFSRFGYKINRVLEPNIVGRTNWNYLEIGTSECVGYGDTPANFMEIINNACRRGVTIWHSHENVGNYSLNNSIV